MDFDEFISDDRYFEVFRDVSNTSVSERFFRCLSHLFNFILENKASPRQVLVEINNTLAKNGGWNGRVGHRLFSNEMTLLVFWLAKLVRQEWEGREAFDKELMRCSVALEGSLEIRLGSDINLNHLDKEGKKQAMQEVRFVVKRRKYKFDNVKQHIKELSDNKARLEYLYEIKAYALEEEDFYSEDRDKFIGKITPEIEKLEKMLILDQSVEQSELTYKVSSSTELSRIKWRGTQVMLVYLFDQLAQNGNIDRDRIWEKVVAHFVKEDGQPFNAQVLAQSLNNIKNSRRTKDTRRVETLIGEMNSLSE